MFLITDLVDNPVDSVRRADLLRAKQDNFVRLVRFGSPYFLPQIKELRRISNC